MAKYFTNIQIDGCSISFYRANNPDASGNTRIIVHYLDFLTDEEKRTRMLFEEKEVIAHRRARIAGFKKFSNREFGGGFIKQYDYCNCRELAQKIVNAIQADINAQ